MIYAVCDRRTTLSPYMRGNPKLGGEGFYTYDKLPGLVGGSCPGASPYCEQICYAKRLIDNDLVRAVLLENTRRGAEVPPLPSDAKIVRWHVSGDFDSVEYIREWCEVINRNPEVRFFGYTRSWRIPELSVWVTTLRDYPNVQLFASMDRSIEEMPPEGWRRAWIEGDDRACLVDNGVRVVDGASAIVCQEETGHKQNCVECSYCILGQRGDVIFLEH